jgi:hypothetical protein
VVGTYRIRTITRASTCPAIQQLPKHYCSGILKT